MDELVEGFFLIALGVFGLIFGSFANVLIWRVPRGESVVSPGSHCPACGNPVRWYDNIPVLSWLVLRARCRDCGSPIHWRYPVVELLSGVLWVLAGTAYGVSFKTLVAVALFYLLLVLAFIDLDVMRLPNVLVLVLAAIGLAGVLASQLLGVPAAPLTAGTPDAWYTQPLALAAIGVVLGAGFVLGLDAVYAKARGTHGFGMGDTKLAAAAALFVGPYVLLALFFGSLLSLAGGLALAARKGEGPLHRRRFPFGPFLAAGIILAALIGPPLVAWYLGIVAR